MSFDNNRVLSGHWVNEFRHFLPLSEKWVFELRNDLISPDCKKLFKTRPPLFFDTLHQVSRAMARFSLSPKFIESSLVTKEARLPTKRIMRKFPAVRVCLNPMKIAWVLAHFVRKLRARSLSIRKHGTPEIPATFRSRRLSDASCDSGITAFGRCIYVDFVNCKSRRRRSTNGLGAVQLLPIRLLPSQLSSSTAVQQLVQPVSASSANSGL